MPGGISSTGLTAIPIPPGGLTGEVLVKLSNATGDYGWGVGGGGGGDVTGLSVIGTVLNLTQSSGVSPITVDLAAADVVFGPGASVDNRLVTWDGATGALIQDGTTIIATGVELDAPAGNITLKSRGTNILVGNNLAQTDIYGAGVLAAQVADGGINLRESSTATIARYRFLGKLGVPENARINFDSSTDDLRLSNFATNGAIEFFTDDGIGLNTQAVRMEANTTRIYASGVEVARSVSAAAGGWQANNTVTGGGFERVLTTSDLTGLTPRGAGAGLVLNVNDLDVGANADGSIQVNANDIQVGVLATDAQHGTRGGGTLHAVAVPSGAAGFLSGADKQKLDDLNLLPAGTAANDTLRWNGAAWEANSRFQIAAGAIQVTDSGGTQQFATAVNAGDVNFTYANIVDMNVGGGGMSGDFNLFSSLVMGGFATIYLTERATALPDTAARGQIWVKDDAPNTLWFTDDTGVDYQIAPASPLFGSNFESDFEATEQSTTSGTYVTPYSYTTAALPAGDYMIVWSFDGGEASDKEASHRVLINGSPVSQTEWRIKEGVAADGKAYLEFAGHRVQTLGAGTLTIAFQYRTSDTAYIRNKQVSIYRVN